MKAAPQPNTAKTPSSNDDHLLNSIFSTSTSDNVSLLSLLKSQKSGFSWPQFMVGGSKADTLIGKSGTQIILSGDGNDTVDGGAGSDLVIAGRGNDTAIYKVGENVRALDYYDGGSGTDTLKLVLTGAEWQRADIKRDVASFLAFLESSAAAKGEIFKFSAFGLAARSFEKLQVVVDGVIIDPRGPDQNALPVALSDQATTNEDTAVVIDVLANDSDGDGDPLAVTTASAANGTVVIGADNKLTYTPNANFYGADSISYTISDGKGGTASATVSVDVGAVNDAASIAGSDTGAVTEDIGTTASGQLIVTDSDVGENKVQAQSGTSGGYGSFSITADGQWTYILDSDSPQVQALASGQTVSDSFVVTSLDGTASKTVVVTINGTDDATGEPVIVVPPPGELPTELAEDGAVIISGISVNVPGFSAALVNTQVAVSPGSVRLTVTDGLTFSDEDGLDGTIAFSGTQEAINHALANSIEYTPPPDYNGPANVTVTFDDGGANPTGVPQVVSTTVPLTVTPVVDILGVLSGNVREDTVLEATGALSTDNPGAGLDFVWSILGGAPASDASFDFRLDNFSIIKNGTTFFEDPFDDGVPPPDTSQQSGTSTAGYAETGTFVDVNGGDAEEDGYLTFSSSRASGAVGAGTDVSFVNNALLVASSVDGGDLASGLKVDDAITMEGVFSLDELPNSAGESFGIRFLDRILTPTSTTPAQAGDDSVEIRVVYSPNGTLNVVMTDRSFVLDKTESLGSFAFAPPEGAEKIALRLSYDPSLSGPVRVFGSFEYLDANNQSVGEVQEFGDVHRVDQFGQLLGSIFNGENWTRAQMFAWAPGTSDASMVGNYGALTLNQSGTWSYALDNDSAAVQALTSSNTVQDTFQVRVVDTDGTVDTKTITINIQGTDELVV